MRVGIDVGLTGAIALLDDAMRFITVADMPVRVLESGRHQVDGSGLGRQLQNWAGAIPIDIFLEQVHTMPGQGVSSSGDFMKSYGIVIGVLEALGFPYTLVSPQVWKKRAGIPKRKRGQPIGVYKDFSRTLAQQLFPGAPLSLKKYCGRGEALLIARFGEKDRLL